MNCPHCQSSDTRQYKKTTSLGDVIFGCHNCGRRFNERTGTAFNYLQFSTYIVMLVVLWRLRYKLSLRDLTECHKTWIQREKQRDRRTKRAK
jgi:putative transposase